MRIRIILSILVGAYLTLGSTAIAAPKTSTQVKKFLRTQAKAGKLLQKLPLASKAVNTKKKAGASILDTSGTPPLLVNIPDSSIKNLFWSNGVIDGLNATPSDSASCNQFFGSSIDGESAGNGACYLAQNVGYSFQTVLESASSFCYMQKMSTAPAGVTITGANSVYEALRPKSDVTEKIIKASITGFPGEGAGSQTIFFVIPGQATNVTDFNIYRHKLYFCNGTTPIGKEEAIIKNNLEYSLFQINKSGGFGTFSSTVKSRITLDENNKIIFNPSTDKEVSMAGLGGFCTYNKAEMTIKAGKIKQKSMDDCGGPEPRKAYSVLRYTGTSIQTLRFQEGGNKDNFGTTITEYRDTRYVSSPNNTEFNSDLSLVNFNTDPFFDGAPVLDTADFEAFDCSRTDADATITMNFANPQLLAHTVSCNDRSLSGMNFCREDPEVASAEAAAYGICTG